MLKPVVSDTQDYTYAPHAAARFPDLPVYLQPANHAPPDPEEEEGFVDTDGLTRRLHWLVETVTTDRWFDAHVLPQLHVLLWGNRRGV